MRFEQFGGVADEFEDVGRVLDLLWGFGWKRVERCFELVEEGERGCDGAAKVGEGILCCELFSRHPEGYSVRRCTSMFGTRPKFEA